MDDFSQPLRGISHHPQYLLVYIAVGVVILFSVPLFVAIPDLFPLFLAALGIIGTIVFVRFGFLVAREYCGECNEVVGLGAVWCPSHRGFRTHFTHPFIQLFLLVGLTYVVGATLGITFNILGTVQPFGGELYSAVAGPGFGFVRAQIGLVGMLAAVPLPVLLGTVLRIIARIRSSTG